MKKFRLKSILVSLLLVIALAAPLVALSSTPSYKAALVFQSVALRSAPDGSVQAVFSVSVDRVVNGNGASFTLDYNSDYFYGPSDQETNALVPNGTVDTDCFFAYDPDLYKEDTNPFSKNFAVDEDDDTEGAVLNPYASGFYCQVLPEDANGTRRLSMALWLDQTTLRENGVDGKIELLEDAQIGEGEDAYVFNEETYLAEADKIEDGKLKGDMVTLGTITLKVKPDRVPEIAKYFQDVELTDNPMKDITYPNGNPGQTFLVRVDQNTPDGWLVGCFQRNHAGDGAPAAYYGKNADNTQLPGGIILYKMTIDPDTIISVRPAEKRVTINAWQAYSYGDIRDVALALTKYSPMATVTYVDGREENIPIPWGEIDHEYTVNGHKDPSHNYKDADFYHGYDPTHGVYTVTQYVHPDHPNPVTVILEVTPITLQRVEVENQTLTFNLNRVVDQVVSESGLLLPEQARLVTDILPGGVSLTIPIPGWQPKNGLWPHLVTGESENNQETLMNSLKEDTYDPAVTDQEDYFVPADDPHWPDDADGQDIFDGNYHRFLGKYNEKTENVDGEDVTTFDWLGKYTFHMAENYGSTGVKADPKPAFTRDEIQGLYPWLTVPNDEYAVPEALRQLVTMDNFTDKTDYVAKWVSTTTGANGQPTLTLSVSKASKQSLNENSIFRVWLPNGMELGTGLNAAVWPDTTATQIDEWFPEITDYILDNDNNVIGTTTRHNGSYEAKGVSIDEERVFNLITNPGDPNMDKGIYGGERETLRRYINLGGWYYVSVCEDPAHRTWSDPMPVYVPPRPNEYQEDKDYNFVEENRALYTWTGSGMTHMVYLPWGTYHGVDREGFALYNVGGAGVSTKTLANTPAYADLVDTKGRPKLDENGRTILQRYEETYAYTTTYDGSTGTQPGRLTTFRVGPVNVPLTDPPIPVNSWDPWPSILEGKTYANHDVFRHGANLDPFYDGALYQGYGSSVTYEGKMYGTVTQPEGLLNYIPIVRRDELTPTKIGNKGLTVTPLDPSTVGIEKDEDGNVTQATFDTRTMGYTSRQEYAFVITNKSTTDPIYGINIDTLIDGHPDCPEGGHFEILQAPATFLPPGGSTVFVLTYVYNLAPGSGESEHEYIDKLYITSTDCPEGGIDKTKGTDYLYDFDARFTVTPDLTHTVTVLVKPEDGSMGTAGLIAGEQNAGTHMNYTPTSSSYARGSKVYISVDLVDMYLPYKAEAVDAAGNNIDVQLYVPKAGHEDIIREGTLVYVFTMPNYDTTVTIYFKEDFTSKLRLDDLIDFSAGTAVELKDSPTNIHWTKEWEAAHPGADLTTEPDVIKENVYPVWRKSFSAEEKSYASDVWAQGPESPAEDLYLMTCGTAIPGEAGNQFISTEKHYLVVIDTEDDFSQVEATLRGLRTTTSGDDTTSWVNQSITPTVRMDWFGADVLETWTLATDGLEANAILTDTKGMSNNPAPGAGAMNPGLGDITAFSEGPDADGHITYRGTTHTSIVFKSPEPGTSNYVRITVSFQHEGSTYTQIYYLEIHRRPAEPIATLHYGNSPYGMIMNAPNFYKKGNATETARLRNLAKDAFRKKYTFDGVISTSLPKILQEDPSTVGHVTYWREAWVNNTLLFEPESSTGFKLVWHEPEEEGGERTFTFEPIKGIYDEAKNMDLNDYAFFAIMGEPMLEPGIQEALDSSGRPVDITKITAGAQVNLLNTAAATQVGAFSGPGMAWLDFGVAGRRLEPADPTDPDSVDADKWPIVTGTKTETVDEEEVTVPTYTAVENIRPGQYVMIYTYPDYDGYHTLSVTRPLIIIPQPGDLNGDGVVDSTRSVEPLEGATVVTEAQKQGTDEYMLKNRVGDPLGYEAGKWDETNKKELTYPRANIYKYRTCDVNNDRDVNNIDGNLINKWALSHPTGSLRFYNPINYGLYSEGSESNPTIHVKKVEMDRPSVTLYSNLTVNNTVQLTAVITPGDATDLSVVWSSSDEDVATVDENGRVTAVGDGIATITAVSADGGFFDICIVTVATYTLGG